MQPITIWTWLVTLILAGCTGSLPEPGLAPSTTRAHCVALDIESDWGAPVGAGLGAASTGLGTMAAIEGAPSRSLKVTAILMGAGALVAGGVGMYASKSWHEQCIVVKP